MRKVVLLLTALCAMVFAASAQAGASFIVQCDGAVKSGMLNPPNQVSKAGYHELNDDPIVYPGQPGASHLHEFVGNSTTDAYSTLSSMLGQPTTCGEVKDTAGYWMPALWKTNPDGSATKYRPDYARIYYTRGGSQSGQTLYAPPPGAQIIGGDAHATGPSTDGRISFSCGKSTPGDTLGSNQAPYDCTPYLGGDSSHDGLTGRVFLPTCWDGVGTARTDFVYGQPCPSTFPKRIPTISIRYHWNVTGASPSNITFGSFPGELTWYQMHADFFNAWDQPTLQTEITNCLNVQPNSCPSFFGPLVGDGGTPPSGGMP